MSLEVAPQTVELLPLDCQADPEYIEDVARTKRFLEWWTADPTFRQELPHDPVGVARAAGLEGDPLALRPLWDPQASADEPSPAVIRYRAFMAEKIAYRNRMREACRSHHPGFDAWRLRQVRRCVTELGPQKSEGLIHAGTALELCAGCSVGCWFCGISALKLDKVWPYEPNRELWQGVVGTLHDRLGEGVTRGFCYWATDPLDNPDYERFCLDFHAAMGRFPQTTTAQPMKDPDRFRKLHRMARERGCEIDRFSILTRGILKKVFAEYTARELLYVELVPQMDGSYTTKAYAGRARDKQERYEKSTGTPVPAPEGTSTIACVSGFLVKLPDRVMELVSPCRSDERWPMGYRVYARRRFADAAEFAAQLEELTSPAMMPARLPLDLPLRLRRDLTGRVTGEDLEIAGAYLKHTFPGLRVLGEELLAQPRTAAELAPSVEARGGPSLPETMLRLHQLYDSGFFDDEPAGDPDA